MPRIPDSARARYHEEMRAATTTSSDDQRWAHLELAHILSQRDPWLHTRNHAAMLMLALRQRDRREAIGQIIRIIAAAPGSLSGRYPERQHRPRHRRATPTHAHATRPRRPAPPHRGLSRNTRGGPRLAGRSSGLAGHTRNTISPRPVRSQYSMSKLHPVALQPGYSLWTRGRTPAATARHRYRVRALLAAGPRVPAIHVPRRGCRPSAVSRMGTHRRRHCVYLRTEAGRHPDDPHLIA
jgi:hypothetical protein